VYEACSALMHAIDGSTGWPDLLTGRGSITLIVDWKGKKGSSGPKSFSLSGWDTIALNRTGG
jgi:hypothetical protein